MADLEKYKTFTVPQVAEFLQVSVRTVRSLIADGNFAKPFRIGGQIRFISEDFFRWLETRGDATIDMKKIKKTVASIKIN
jgi:excisionase family DNA binding protein